MFGPRRTITVAVRPKLFRFDVQIQAPAVVGAGAGGEGSGTSRRELLDGGKPFGVLIVITC